MARPDEMPPTEELLNVELKYLSEDVRVAFQNAREKFERYMSRKATAGELVFALDNLLHCLIATSRYTKKEIDGIAGDLRRAHLYCNPTGQTQSKEFVKLIQKCREKMSWMIAHKNLFHRIPVSEMSVEDRV